MFGSVTLQNHSTNRCQFSDEVRVTVYQTIMATYLSNLEKVFWPTGT